MPKRAGSRHGILDPEPLGFDYVIHAAVSHAQKGRALESQMVVMVGNKRQRPTNENAADIRKSCERFSQPEINISN